MLFIYITWLIIMWLMVCYLAKWLGLTGKQYIIYTNVVIWATIMTVFVIQKIHN